MGKRKDPTEQVRIYTDTAEDIRSVCAALKIEFPDYVRDRLRLILKRDLAEAAKALAERSEQQEGPKTPRTKKRD